MTHLWRVLICVGVAGAAWAGAPRLSGEPQRLQGVPGQPLSVLLTVETDHAHPIELRVPTVTNLVLRTIETIPIQRTPDGRFVQQRMLMWQGLEAGRVVLTNLTAEINGARFVFPPLEIVIDPVAVATPPAPKDAE